MSRQINQPINQVRLTNVAVVRMNKGGKRFEIACYRNKVVNYRQGLEQDLSEVLQTERVFTNVSKGEFAKAKDLQKVFGTKDEEEIAKQILVKGQLQVSDKERSQQLEKTTAQIAEWISKNCVHPNSERPYTISQIRHAMQQSNFSVHPTKPIKRQYLDCVKLLQGSIPIQRAKMELLLYIPSDEDSVIEQTMKDNNVQWETVSPNDSTTGSAQIQYKILVDPSMYRVLNDVIQKMEGAKIEIITQVVTKQGDTNLEAELENNTMNEAMLDVQIQEQSNELSKMTVSSQDNGSDDDHGVDLVASRRKQQKKARKKNRKDKRRGEADEGSSILSSDVTQTAVQSPVTTLGTTAPASGGGNNDGRKSCNTCGGFFDTAAAYRAHFKSDWHKFNQKLKMKGAAPISEQEFLLCDSDTFFGDGML